MKKHASKFLALATVVTATVAGVGIFATDLGHRGTTGADNTSATRTLEIPGDAPGAPESTGPSSPDSASNSAASNSAAASEAGSAGQSGTTPQGREATLSRGLSDDTETAGRNAGALGPQKLAPRSEPIERTAPEKVTFVIATHNVLGASHTRNGGRGFAGAETRMGWSVGLLNDYNVDIVGLQEFQQTQYQMFTARMPGYSVYPGGAAGPLGYENSIAWRDSMFELVDAQTIGIPYFGGRIRPMPVIHLRERTTGREFFVANFHNPADTHGPAGRWRAAATQIEINLVNDLREKTGLPVFITGDMNERESWFCTMTAGTGMAAASGGGTGSPCQPPPGPVPVDWIVHTPDAQTVEYHDVRTGIITRTSDHPLLVATILLDELAGVPEE